MKFNKRLKELRTATRLTQRELADRSGVSYSYITKLESGEADNPTREKLEAIGKVLNAPLSAIYDFGELVESPNPLSATDEHSKTAGASHSFDTLSLAEKQLISYFRGFNQEGQDKAIDLLDDLAASGKYIKTDSVGMVVEEKQA